MGATEPEKNPVIDAVIPVYRPDDRFLSRLWMLKKQALPVRKIILMVTESEVPLREEIREMEGVEIHSFPPSEFDHGETRNRGAACSDADLMLFLTQDAEPADTHLTAELAAAFSEEKTGASYARQLPRPSAGIPEKLTREFNYPASDRIQSLETLPEYGIKTYFCSNAAAMYDRRIFEELGGFIHRTIFNEDMIYAFKLVQAGYVIRYVSSAKVVHSHDYTAKELFRRNFDLGVSQADHPEIFGTVSSEKEGASLVETVMKELLSGGHLVQFCRFFWQSFQKYRGYRTGKNYRKLPMKRILKYTMNPTYWENRNGTDPSDNV